MAKTATFSPALLGFATVTYSASMAISITRATRQPEKPVSRAYSVPQLDSWIVMGRVETQATYEATTSLVYCEKAEKVAKCSDQCIDAVHQKGEATVEA